MAYTTIVAKAYTTRQGYWDDIKTFMVAAGWTEVSPDAGAVTVAYTAVDTTGETITSVGHPFTNGMTVIFNSTGTLPSPLAINTQYFIVGVSGNTFQLASAVGGSAINLTTQGTGNHTIAGCMMVYKSAGTYTDRLAEYLRFTRLTNNQILIRSGLKWVEATKVMSAMGYTFTAHSITTTEGSFNGWMYGDSNKVNFISKVSSTYYQVNAGHISTRFDATEPNIVLESGFLGKVETASGYGINVPNIDDYEVGRYYQIIEKDVGRNTVKVASKTTARTDHGAARIPTMTSNTAPSPVVMSASSEYNTGSAAWKSVDGAVDDIWLSSGVVMPIWLKVDFGSGNDFVAVMYALHGNSGYSVNCLKNWTFEGSNNDSGWTVLDTRTGEVGWVNGEVRVYQFSNAVSYRYYRLNISAINGGATYGGAVCAWQICGATTPSPASDGQLLLGGSYRGTWNFNYTGGADCRFGTLPSLFGVGSELWGTSTWFGSTCPMNSTDNTDCASGGLYWQGIGGLPTLGGSDVHNENAKMALCPQWLKSMTTGFMGFVGYDSGEKCMGCDSTGMAQEDLLYITSLSSGTSTGSNTVTTLNDTGKTWTVNAYANKAVVIATGTGLGQARKISSNTATKLTISADWTVTPDATSTYVVCEEAWRYFAQSALYEAP